MRQVDGAGQEVDEPFRCVAVHVVSQEHDDDEPLCKGISGASGIPVLTRAHGDDFQRADTPDWQRACRYRLIPFQFR